MNILEKSIDSLIVKKSKGINNVFLTKENNK